MVSKVTQRIINKFGDIYNYDKLDYQGPNVKVTITCPAHGDFHVWPYNYINGKGCPACSLRRAHDAVMATTEDFIAKSRAKHGDRYDYSKAVYTGKKEKITVICREHGEFFPTASNHYINGTGCPKCGVEKAHAKFRKPIAQFIEDSKKVHGDKYDYSRATYTSNKKHLIIVCPKHGEFEQRPDCHLYKAYGCPKCSSNGTSRAEQELFEYIKSLVGDLAVNRYKTESGIEIDVAVPSKNIGFELNGLYWHSEEMGKGLTYHVEKTEKCAEEGLKLIHIFEDEWKLGQAKVKSKIQHLLGVNTNRIYARDTEARMITVDQAKTFLNLHHIQGAGLSGSFNAGLFTKDNVLIAVMNFCWDRYSRTSGTVELLRFASSRHVVGGASKLLKFYIRNKDPEVTTIISYSDRRWSEGNLYRQLGFSLVRASTPSYFYVDPSRGVRMNRQRFQKHRLKEMLSIFDPSKTEVENCKMNGLFRIFDCGTHKWELKLDQT